MLWAKNKKWKLVIENLLESLRKPVAATCNLIITMKTKNKQEFFRFQNYTKLSWKYLKYKKMFKSGHSLVIICRQL